ncbi:MAG: glycosyl transferase [Methylophaga sp.]|nr:MAG: glycosyl transferase [Methylophaga sp.]
MVEQQRTYAPIALFVYNRLDHTRQTINALLTNDGAAESHIYIFSDASQNNAENEIIQEVRSYIHSIDGFKDVTIIEREVNFGLARSVIEGVTKICEEHGRIIVLEDDLVVSPYFLKYMNNALNMYDTDSRVCSISGYMYPVNLSISENTFFCKAPHSWGWATWEVEWDLFNDDGKALLNRIESGNLTQSFEKNGPYSYLKMLKQQVAGENNSWYIRWYASCFLHNKLTLMPSKSLVQNIGIDGTGVHCAKWKYNPFLVELAQQPVDVEFIPVIDRNDIYGVMTKYHRKVRRLRVLNFVYRLVNSLGLKK